jgi:hypothetical protein
VPGARERVHLLDVAAPCSTARIRLDTAGRGRGAFRVRPVREGWHEWSVQPRCRVTRTAAGWALPERAPRVLLAAGPPSAGSRDLLVRALEEAGAAVELRQPLGHGLTAGAVRVSLPVDAAQLAGFDVVIVLHGAVLDETRRAALQHYVMQYGGGVLIATRDPLLQRLGLAEGAQPDARSVGASSVIWSLPPELTPLPAGDEVSAAEPLVAAAAAFTAAADAQGSALLVLRSAGHGRAAALGLRESWHWRVAGGRIDEHREFWRSLVDWLAPRPPVPHVDVPYTIVETGLPVQVDVDAGTPLPPLRLRRPDGAAEPLPRSVGTADRAYYRFLPADTGLHAVLLPGDSVLAAVRALAAGSRAARTARAPMAGAAAADHAAAGARALDAARSRRRAVRGRAHQPQPQPVVATRERQITGLSDNETWASACACWPDGTWGFAASRDADGGRGRARRARAVAQARANAGQPRPVELAPAERRTRRRRWRSPIEIDPFTSRSRTRSSLLAANAAALGVQRRALRQLVHVLPARGEVLREHGGHDHGPDDLPREPNMNARRWRPTAPTSRAAVDGRAAARPRLRARARRATRRERAALGRGGGAEAVGAPGRAGPLRPGAAAVAPLAHDPRVDRAPDGARPHHGLRGELRRHLVHLPLEDYLGKFRYGPEFMNVQGERSTPGGSPASATTTRASGRATT